MRHTTVLLSKYPPRRVERAGNTITLTMPWGEVYKLIVVSPNAKDDHVARFVDIVESDLREYVARAPSLRTLQSEPRSPAEEITVELGKLQVRTRVAR